MVTAVIGVRVGGRPPTTREPLLDRIKQALQCLLFPIAVADFAFDAANLIELPPQLILGQRSLKGGPSISQQSALPGQLLAEVVGLLNIGRSRCGDIVISDPQRAHLPYRNPSAPARAREATLARPPVRAKAADCPCLVP